MHTAHARTRRPARRRDDRRRGAALVELAIMIPIFVALTLGSVQVVTATHHATQLSQAVREGGRLATLAYASGTPISGDLNAKVASDVKAFLAAGGLDATNATVTVTHAGGASDGQTFDLGDPDNSFEEFAIEASLPADTHLYGDWLTGGGPAARIVFRSGRIFSPGS